MRVLAAWMPQPAPIGAGARRTGVRPAISNYLDGLLDYSSTAILKWERSGGKRLDKVNEVVVRTWAAEQLRLEISGRLSKLVGVSNEQERVTLKAA